MLFIKLFPKINYRVASISWYEFNSNRYFPVNLHLVMLGLGLNRNFSTMPYFSQTKILYALWPFLSQNQKTYPKAEKDTVQSALLFLYSKI